ncbi:hypothetical protein BASA50_010791 [Batrachochytrium salamandrivorans]|uniref:Uncharacterized protein n=1 Tax=Batrachochytrium salamandrivorans TaxID=1357716 RepID=A0ABQ8EXK9_9FUNG|nr:hypothetical protein BASA60_000101 [Batrachochytrium salamandrivorans]KAH6575496.1 hypothetical protein BASA62_001887 [Batrachochytrium salamandrivorans]KAH6588311.1 hypothetical protein BASA50_010786 [Batrachochytrium salamandrivorans]KAH6588316.1 hypothetical protein BASA50_010791 [Batrachochytrium salamandrivorans]KAH6591672.1 hypothetical protein BASA61_004871 [Batrachochytrium salamandrivorans]
MRDARKLCGLTVHQQVSLPTASVSNPDTSLHTPGSADPLSNAAIATTDHTTNPTGATSSSSKNSAGQARNKGRLGVQCPEYAFKDADERGRTLSGGNSGLHNSHNKRKQAHLAPADYRGKAYLGVPSPADPFSVYVWYTARQPGIDPEFVCVDVTVDGKRSPGWVLRSGRNHGVSIEQIMHRGRPTSFEFSPAKVSLTSNLNTNSSVVCRPALAGTIEAKFWRVMKLDGAAVLTPKRRKHSSSHPNSDADHSLDAITAQTDTDSTDNDEMDNETAQYIPDEGVPALCVLTLHYRDMTWLTMTSSSNSTAGSTSRARSALADSTNKRSSTPTGKPAAATATSADAEFTTATPTRVAKGRSTKKTPKKMASDLVMSELCTILSSPVVSRRRQMNYSVLQSSSPLRGGITSANAESMFTPFAAGTASTSAAAVPLLTSCRPLAIASLCEEHSDSLDPPPHLLVPNTPSLARSNSVHILPLSSPSLTVDAALNPLTTLPSYTSSVYEENPIAVSGPTTTTTTHPSLSSLLCVVNELSMLLPDCPPKQAEPLSTLVPHKKEPLAYVAPAIDTPLDTVVVKESTSSTVKATTAHPLVQTPDRSRSLSPVRSRVMVCVCQPSLLPISLDESLAATTTATTTITTGQIHPSHIIACGRMTLSNTDTKTSLTAALARTVAKLLSSRVSPPPIPKHSNLSASKPGASLESQLGVYNMRLTGVWVDEGLGRCVSLDSLDLLNDMGVSLIRCIHVLV